jgi:hypothetical protein
VFPAFYPDRTTERFNPDGEYPDVPRSASTVLLDTDGRMPRLPMAFTTGGVWTASSHAITPFEPAAGYRADPDDFDATRRGVKLRGRVAWDELTKHPLNLYVGLDWERMEELGIDLGDAEHALRPALWPIVRALRLHLEFPTGIRLESRPDAENLSGGGIAFGRFYPADTGPLARPDGALRYMGAGLQLALPGDPRALAQIRGRFSLDRQSTGADVRK